MVGWERCLLVDQNRLNHPWPVLDIVIYVVLAGFLIHGVDSGLPKLMPVVPNHVGHVLFSDDIDRLSMFKKVWVHVVVKVVSTPSSSADDLLYLLWKTTCVWHAIDRYNSVYCLGSFFFVLLFGTQPRWLGDNSLYTARKEPSHHRKEARIGIPESKMKNWESTN